VRAGFTDNKQGLFLYALEVDYPVAEAQRVFDELMREPALGKVYSETKPGTVEWDWGHSRVTLQEEPTKILLSVRSVLETGGPKSLFTQRRTVSPWAVELGHDSQATAESKLTAAGFSVQTRCVDLTPQTSNVRVQSCSFENNGVVGLKYMKMELTAFGAVQPKVSELECVYEPMMVDVLRRELRDRHGEPLKGSPKETPTWWTVPAGIFMMTAPDYLSVSYQHGRLHRIAQFAVKASGP
jgi:hypothetical protein